MSAGKSFKIVLLAAMIVAAGAGFYIQTHKSQVLDVARYVDRHYLGEGIRDIRAQLTTEEHWGNLPHSLYDYGWLQEAAGEDGPVRIAHALGKLPASNSFAALEQSRAAGFSVFEVDLWLDEQGELRCHHGPKPPPALKASDCTFPQLLDNLRAGEVVVLDIKSGFTKTANAVLALFEQEAFSSKAAQMVFQLYKPAHVKLFADWHKRYNLAGPIVTAYKSERGLRHVYKGVRDAGIKVLTFPLERLPVLTGDKTASDGVVLFTHPVSSCQDMMRAAMYGMGGVYIINNLECKA